MKKRKELDALLVSNGKIGKKKKRSDTGHELLRTHDSSSEVEEYCAAPRKTIVRKKTRSRLCAICFPICAFVLVVACIAVCSGLVWMNIDLKKDVDELRLRLQKVEEDSKGNSGEYGALRTDVEKIKENIESVTKSEDEQIQKLQSDLSYILSQITLLNKTTKSLSDSVSASSELLALPTTVQSLQQSVAKLGSDVTSLQAKVVTVESAERQNENSVDNVKTDVQSVKERLDSMELSVMIQDNHNDEDKELQVKTTLAPLMKTLTTPTPAHELLLNTEQKVISGQVTGQTGRPETVTGDISAVQSYLQQEIDRVGLDVEDLNTTIVTLQNQYMSLISRVTLLETGVTAPASLTNDSTHIDIQEMYNDLHNLMDVLQQNMTNSGDVEIDKEGMKALEEEIENLTDLVLELRERVNGLNPNDLNNNLLNPNTTRGLQEILHKTSEKIMEDNKAMMAGFQSNIDSLWNQFAQQSGTVTSIQRDVIQMKNLVNSLAQNTEELGGVEPSQIPPNSEVSSQNNYQAASEPNVPTGDNIPNPDYNPEIANPDLYPQNPDVSNTGQQETGTIGDPAVNTAIAPPASLPTVKPNQSVNVPITLKGIYSSEDLLNHFLLWDSNDDGFVSYNDMLGFFGPQLAPLETLNTYDFDHNGLFDRDELATALGFLEMPASSQSNQPVTAEQPSQITAGQPSDTQQGGEKPGTCPTLPPGTLGTCGELCTSDLNCGGDRKCCSTGCGHMCMQPVISSSESTAVTEKPGTCPVVPSGMVGVCTEYCSSDADCVGDTKCCSNGCGHKCMQPVMDPVEGDVDDQRQPGNDWGRYNDEKKSQSIPDNKPQYPDFPHKPQTPNQMQEWKNKLKQSGLYPSAENPQK